MVDMENKQQSKYMLCGYMLQVQHIVPLAVHNKLAVLHKVGRHKAGQDKVEQDNLEEQDILWLYTN